MLYQLINKFRKFASGVIVVGLAVTIAACSSGSTTPSSGNGGGGTPTFKLTSPVEYVSGVNIKIYLTMSNTSNYNASGINYFVESNTTGANILVDPNGAGNHCTTIAANQSCVFTATIESNSTPGSFTVTATTDNLQSQSGNNIADVPANQVAVNIGLVSIPANFSSPLLLLPYNQTLNTKTTTQNILFSVFVAESSDYPLMLKNGDGSAIYPAPVLISPPPLGGAYHYGDVATFSVSYAAESQQTGVESLVAYSTDCTGVNCLSNTVYVNFVESGAGILSVSPSYTTLTPDYTSQSYTLINTGESVISVTFPPVTAPFSLVSNCGNSPFTLQPYPADGCSFSINYTPGLVTGAESFVLSYTNGISGTESTVFAIEYVGLAPIFTWKNGSNTINQPGVYGTIGQTAPDNVPGARYSSASWTDESGNFWLFGGVYSQGVSYFNDLWMYNPTSGQWTWMNGSSSANSLANYGIKGQESSGNVPGARYSATRWTDESGNFWLFGGYGYNNTNGRNVLNDLWKFDTTTMQWVWVSGSSSFAQTGVYGALGVESAGNIPGARVLAASWRDESQNLWLFGGVIQGSNTYYNDLWRFNINSGMWTWMGGSNTTNKAGTYGTKGVGSISNIPGSRYSAMTWVDKSGNFWLFGGSGYASSQYLKDALNDLWMYNPNTSQWTWVSGSMAINQRGNYGTQGVSIDTNIPGARNSAVSWSDESGNFYLFGGVSSQLSKSVFLNDLWQYNINTGLWTWIAGSSLINQPGNYGTLGYGTESTVAGARWGSTGWADESGNLWLFGGQYNQTPSTFNSYNDLWQIKLNN